MRRRKRGKKGIERRLKRRLSTKFYVMHHEATSLAEGVVYIYRRLWLISVCAY